MNGFDVALLVLLGVLVVVGMIKGMVRILIGLAALVTAFLVASRYHEPLATRLPDLTLEPETLRLVSYVLLFVCVMLAGSVVAWIVRKIVKAAMLGWADRLAGAALGAVLGVVLAALLVLPVAAYAPGGMRLLDRSALAPYVAAVSDLAIRAAPADLAERYRRGIDALRRLWRETPPPSLTASGRDTA